MLINDMFEMGFEIGQNWRRRLKIFFFNRHFPFLAKGSLVEKRKWRHAP